MKFKVQDKQNQLIENITVQNVLLFPIVEKSKAA